MWFVNFKLTFIKGYILSHVFYTFSGLAEDLKLVQEKFGYNYIELEMVCWFYC
jgi:ABC-type glucose/galactose transport system permease subunit